MSSWISNVSSKLKRYSILSLEMLQSITVFLLVFTMMNGNWKVERQIRCAASLDRLTIAHQGTIRGEVLSFG